MVLIIAFIIAGGKSVVYTTKYKSMDVCSNRVVIVLPVESSTTQASGTGDVNYAAVCKLSIFWKFYPILVPFAC